MKKLIIVWAALAASAGLAQAPAADTTTSQAAPANTAAAEKDPNEMICRNIEQTSTRLGRMRACKTRAEWAASERQVSRNVQQAQSR